MHILSKTAGPVARVNPILIVFMVVLQSSIVAEDDRSPAQSLPDIDLSGENVSVADFDQLAQKHWGSVQVKIHQRNSAGAVFHRLNAAGSIRTLHAYGEGAADQIPRLENLNGLVGLTIEIETGHHLEALGKFNHLESLSLTGCPTINTAGARELAQLTKLTSLSLYNVNIDDSAFAELSTLVNLEELNLCHTRITDLGLKAIEQMPRLRSLQLARHPGWYLKQQLTDDCVSSIMQLTELEQLSISGEISDESLTEIVKLPRLKSLSIYHSAVTTRGLAALQDSAIQSLSLSAGQIGDTQGVETLKGFRALKNVHVIGDSNSVLQNFDAWMQAAPNLSWSFDS